MGLNSDKTSKDFCINICWFSTRYYFFRNTVAQKIQNSLARAIVKAPKSSHMTPILKSLHWLKVNKQIKYKLLSRIWSLFNPLAVPAPHLLSPFLAHQSYPHWKSQIAHSDMHHPVSGIKWTHRFIPSASPVMSRLTSSFVSWSLSSSPLSPTITPSLRAQNLPFQQILPP